MALPSSFSPAVSPWQSPSPQMAVPVGTFGVLQGVKGPFSLHTWLPRKVVAHHFGNWPSNPIDSHAFANRKDQTTFNM